MVDRLPDSVLIKFLVDLTAYIELSGIFLIGSNQHCISADGSFRQDFPAAIAAGSLHFLQMGFYQSAGYAQDVPKV